MEFGLADRRPMEALEQRRVLALHVGKETLAPPCVSRRHREADQRTAQGADPPVLGRNGKARAPPDAPFRLMNPHGADNFVRRDAERRDDDDRDRDPVDGVGIVAGKNTLLVAEHAPPQCRGIVAFPRFGRELDPVLRGQKNRERIEHHAPFRS
jgi:hypothetical protein